MFKWWQKPEIKDTKACRVCGEPIKSAASKCTHCDSYQDWRANLSLSNTALALLVALFSVLSTAVPAIVKALQPNNSELSFIFEGSGTGVMNIMVLNKGNKPGVLRSPAELEISRPGQNQIIIPLAVSGAQSAFIIEHNDIKILDLVPPADSGPLGTTLSELFLKNGQNRLLELKLEIAECRVRLRYNNFREPNLIAVVLIPCKELYAFIFDINARLQSRQEPN